MSPPGSIGVDDWFVDEVGIAFGVIGPWRVKTLYQPVYERRGDVLAFVAISASSVLERAGRPIEAQAVPDLLTMAELWQARRLSAELAIRNLVLHGSEDPIPDTIVPAAFAPDRLSPGIDHLMRLASLDGVGVPKLVLDLSGTDPVARSRALSRPGVGIRYALDLASAAEMPERPHDRPELLRVPATWSRRLLASGHLAPQVRRLGTVLGRGDRRIQVEGVDSPALLRAALAGGAGRLQGLLLAPSSGAGTELDRRPLSIPDFLSRDDTDEVTA